MSACWFCHAVDHLISSSSGSKSMMYLFGGFTGVMLNDVIEYIPGNVMLLRQFCFQPQCSSWQSCREYCLLLTGSQTDVALSLSCVL